MDVRSRPADALRLGGPDGRPPRHPRHAEVAFLLALALGGCASYDSREPSPAEAAFCERLEDLVLAYAERTGEPEPGEIGRALTAARASGRLRIFEQHEDEESAVRGFVQAGVVHVHQSVVANLPAPGDPSPEQVLTALTVYYHEGVHLTQTWIEIFFARGEAEEEAYQLTHRFEAGLLLRILAGEDFSDLGLSSCDPPRLLQAYAQVHRAFAGEEVGARCEERRFDLLDGEGPPLLLGRPACSYRGIPREAEVEFFPAGPGRAMAVLSVAVDPVEAANEQFWRMPSAFDPTVLLPGYSAEGRLESLALGWYASAPAGSMENRAEEWNLAAGPPRILSASPGSVEVLLDIEGPPGHWRLAFAPYFTLSFDLASLSAYELLPAEEDWVPWRLARFAEEWADHERSGRSVFLYYDRRRRQADLVPVDLGPVAPTPLALARIEFSGPDFFRPPATGVLGHCLPGSRSFDSLPAGFDRTWGRPLDVLVLWEPGCLREEEGRLRQEEAHVDKLVGETVPGRPRVPGDPYFLLAHDSRSVIALVDAQDFATSRPAYRVAVAYGERPAGQITR
ncbi:MAG: hypothetical protein HY720_29300 [Planctomycetes bacterium]|nr:hypothetical protein [Planctomycetota bacterium]